ncbi:MAG: DUF2769 domain-containing protein [Methanobacteriaceae archaeon]|jgi:hypothetical protein|nr:DUF2769 domain-containing protein [Methanobacteriaceae archaeon]
MDDVEAFLQSLESMSPEEREEELERFKSQCICPICPTYNECAKEKGELLFCIIGESEKCITDKKDCLCPPCPFARRLSFGARYTTYCMRGSEIEQRKIKFY